MSVSQPTYTTHLATHLWLHIVESKRPAAPKADGIRGALRPPLTALLSIGQTPNATGILGGISWFQPGLERGAPGGMDDRPLDRSVPQSLPGVDDRVG